MNVLMIIVGILLFDSIILAHEFGHFFWAKKFGVKVNEFALGMGPQIFKFKKGETVFSLRAFPIGGFCAMEGEDEETINADGNISENSFKSKPAWQAAIIIAFGAIMNIILGFIMTIITLIPNKQFASTTISKFNSEAISCNSGLHVGDTITKIDNAKIRTYKDIGFNLLVDGKSTFDIEVKREGKTIKLENVIFKTETNSKGGTSTKLDFYVEPIENNFINLLKQSFLDTISTAKTVWSSLAGLVTGRFSMRNMSGPIGIASMIGEATNEGLKVSIWAAISNIMSLMAMITINLGIFNLLPLPALDGGRLLVLIFEMVFGKKINAKYEALIHMLGFIAFIAFMIYISYSDILRLLGKS